MKNNLIDNKKQKAPISQNQNAGNQQNEVDRKKEQNSSLRNKRDEEDEMDDFTEQQDETSQSERDRTVKMPYTKDSIESKQNGNQKTGAHHDNNSEDLHRSGDRNNEENAYPKNIRDEEDDEDDSDLEKDEMSLPEKEKKTPAPYADQNTGNNHRSNQKKGSKQGKNSSNNPSI